MEGFKSLLAIPQYLISEQTAQRDWRV